MDFDDSPADQDYRARCRAWLDEHAEPRNGARSVGALGDADEDQEREHVAAAQAWQQVLADAGWAGIAWPTEFGGQGRTGRQQAIFDEEQSRYDVPESVFAQGIGMAGPTLIAHGTDAQKARFLPPMLRGEEIWCQLFSEPGAGSDLASLSTRADRDGDTFVVNGQKVWTSSAQYSDWGILLARTNLDAPKHRGISYLLVDMTTPGIEVRPLRQSTGVAHFNEVFLTDVAVPAENVVGAIDDGWRVTMTTLTSERTMIGASANADAGEELLDLYREVGGGAVLRQRVVDAYIHDRLIRYLGWRAQTAFDRGETAGPEASVVKLAHSRLQAELGDVVMALLGARGLLTDYADTAAYPWQIRFLAQWASRLGGGTEQVQRNILGERMLGLPREPSTDRDVPFRDLARGR